MTAYQCAGCGDFFPTDTLMFEHGDAILADPVRLAEHQAYAEDAPA